MVFLDIEALKNSRIGLSAISELSMYKYHPCWIWEVALDYPWSSSSLYI